MASRFNTGLLRTVFEGTRYEPRLYLKYILHPYLRLCIVPAIVLTCCG